MFDLDTLRMGKVLEIIDMLTYDSSKLYLSQTAENKSTSFASIAMGGLQFQNTLRADANIGINVYPIATTNSTITIRADLLQQRQPEVFDIVFSTSYLLAARNKDNQKQAIPQIDLGFSDDLALAKQRSGLAINQNELFRYYDPRKSSTRAPI